VPPVPGYKQNLSWRENNLVEYKHYLTSHFIGLVLLSLLACHVYEREGNYGLDTGTVEKILNLDRLSSVQVLGLIFFPQYQYKDTTIFSNVLLS